MKINKVIFIFFLLIPSFAFAKKKGLGMEMGVGYSNMSVSTSNATAKYSGIGVQGDFLIPFYSKGLFNAEFDLSYKYTSVTNNASTANSSEWGNFDGFGLGCRLNYSYFFLGADYLFMDAKHIIVGNSSGLFDYSYNPIQIHGGIAFPIAQATSIVLGYTHMLANSVRTQGQDLTLQDGTFWIRIQIDFRDSFISLYGPSETTNTGRQHIFY